MIKYRKYIDNLLHTKGLPKDIRNLITKNLIKERYTQHAPHTRIYIYFARDSPIALIARVIGKPLFYTQLIKWNIENDTFEKGQWISKQFFPYKSHLSPNGKYFVCALRNHKNGSMGWDDSMYTVVSKIPYFSALIHYDHNGICQRCDSIHPAISGGYWYEDNHLALRSLKNEKQYGKLPNNLQISQISVKSSNGGPDISSINDSVKSIWKGNRQWNINNFEYKSKKDLIQILKTHKIKGYAKLNKQQLLEFCKTKIPTPFFKIIPKKDKDHRGRIITFDNGYILANDKPVYDFLFDKFEKVAPPPNYFKT